MRSTRLRRGVALVEFMLILPFYATSLFGAMELGQIFYDRVELTNACREGARRAAVSKSLADIYSATINSAPRLGITNGDIAVEYDTSTDGSGNWQAAADNVGGTANAIPAGHLCRVAIRSWKHRMLTGSYFNFLPHVSSSGFSMSATEIMVRE